MSTVISDFEQGVKAANRVRIRTNMDIDSTARMQDTPVQVVDKSVYMRGVFESCGVFDECALSMFNAQNVTEYLNSMGIAFTCTSDGSMVLISHANAHDFLGMIYAGIKVITPKHVEFMNHIGGMAKCRVWRTDKDAVVPFKTRPSDVGFDLVALRLYKQLSAKTALYDTGIKIQVELGYYAEIVPRSSISKSGYMLANSIGIIDPGYTGNLYIALTKIDDNAPDIQFPFRGCQLIIRRQVHAEMEVMDDVSSLGLTGRGQGGFGSTD